MSHLSEMLFPLKYPGKPGMFLAKRVLKAGVWPLRPVSGANGFTGRWWVQPVDVNLRESRPPW
jgi:hypothetical protein